MGLSTVDHDDVSICGSIDVGQTSGRRNVET